MDLSKREVLVKFILDNNLEYGAEIGLKSCSLFCYLLKNIQNLKMVGVDLWGPPTYDEIESQIYYSYDHTQNYLECKRCTSAFKHRSTLIRSSSLKACTMFKDNSFDFVFIDADHSTKAVIDDINAWKSKTRFLLGHDADWESVRRALELYDHELLSHDVWILK